MADWGPCDPSSIPLGEKKENKLNEAGVGPYKKTFYPINIKPVRKTFSQNGAVEDW